MAGPALSMLWERTDPVSALPERFGLPDAAAAVTMLTATLAEDWGLRVTACERIVLSAQNLLAWMHTEAGPFVVKACARQPLFARLGTIAEVVVELGAQGLPVAAPRRTRGGAAHSIIDKLATRFQSWDPPPSGARQQLVAGYRSEAVLTPAEEQWLEAAMLAGGLGQIPAGADPAGWAAAVERGL